MIDSCMDYLTQFTTYIFTLALAAILPGPGMTGLMFKTLTHGHRNGLIMLLGLITGDIIFLLISIFLISSLTQIVPNFSFYLVMLSSIYLLYLAHNFWSFKGDLFQIKNKNSLGETFFAYKDGLLITLSNPKTISFYLAFVPAIFGASSLKEQTFYLIIITILILAIIGSLYIFFSWGLKKFLRNLKIQNALLKGLSLTMCILALSMIYREFTPHLI